MWDKMKSREFRGLLMLSVWVVIGLNALFNSSWCKVHPFCNAWLVIFGGK